MNILNKKNWAIFLLTGLVVVFALVGSPILVIAQDSRLGQTSLSGESCAEPPSGLVSRWNGDGITGRSESERNIVADFKGKNNGIIRGKVSIRPWENGNNFHPDGSSGYIRMENSKSLNFGTSPFSLEVWFRLGLRGRGIPPGNIIRKSNYPVKGPGYGYWLKAGGDDRVLEFFAGETTGIPGESRGRITTTISPDTWYHVVATKDSAGTMELYVNGELKGTAEAPGANTTSEAPFTLGAWVDRFGVTEAFFGVIGGVSIYDRALSQSEVVSIFNAGNDGRCQSYLGSAPQKPPGFVTPEPQMPEPQMPGPQTPPTPVALSKIKYPVAELGSCGSLQECKTYCGTENNYSKCAAFAQKHGLETEIPSEKQAILKAMQKGESPGQCKDEVSCRNYCENTDNIGECVNFVEKFKLASADELKEMRKMASVKQAGVSFPGNCKTKESCLKYCDNSANAVVCMEFAQKAGFIPKEDIEAVNKILPYLKSGGKLPGGCTSKKSCDTYCANDANTIECVDFAAGAGFMTKEDADIVKKTGGKGPGNCKSREACDSYCKDAAHIDECVDFAVKAGFISEADAADAKKYKITSGPGNCKSKSDCEAFCVVNQDVCFQFAKDHGMISEEDLKNIEQYRNQGPPDFSQVNPKWLACMEKEMGSAAFGRFKAGKSDRSDVSAIQAAQKKCQSEMGPDTKECLAKPTCEEFFSCLNPSGRQTSQQEGLEQESPPELKERMDFCKKESVEIKKKEVQEKFDACFTLSCSEYESCMKSIEQSGDQQDGQQQAQGTPDPKIKAKAEACQKEKTNACLTKSCGEFQACINALGGSGGGQQQGASDPAVVAKFQSCQPKNKGAQQSPQVDCSLFASTPQCSYVGSPDSQNYKYCKQCYPNK